jgi:hypothetical protein
VHNDYFSKSLNDHTDFKISQDSTDQQIIYSNNVSLTIVKTDEKMPYLQIEKQAKGRDLGVAKNKAEKIQYGYKFEGNQLILDNYLLTDLKNKFRDQEVELTLYLPEGTVFKVDNSVENFDRSDDEFFNLHYSSDDYIYKVNNSQVKCLNCPLSENDFNDVETGYDASSDTIREVILKVNGKEIITSETTSKTTKLTVDKNGIIIKTN